MEEGRNIILKDSGSWSEAYAGKGGGLLLDSLPSPLDPGGFQAPTGAVTLEKKISQGFDTLSAWIHIKSVNKYNSNTLNFS